LDYLAARLHGRRSRLAEAERLEGLCRLSNLPELGRAVYPETEFQGTADFQRRLAQDPVWELNGFLKHLEGAGADLLAWMLARFQMENIKVLLRALMHRTPLEPPEEYLLSLPHGLALDVQALVAADSLEIFTERLPAGDLRKSLREALGIYRDQPRPFFLEGALDRGYFRELLARAERLSGEDLELIQPIMLQEVDAFHLMLVVRGKFNYGLTPELLLPLHVRQSGIPSERFSAMLAASDIAAAASLAVGRAIDALPSERGSAAAPAPIDPSALESLAWKRFRRLSNRAFRRSHMGLGAVFGYVGIRRVEVANLIMLSEGIVTGTSAETLRARLLPRNDLEPVYV
jgi:V/A-type H+-transporting ATPase subunit C